MQQETKALQRLFCYYYAQSGNIEDAAIKAGFPQSQAIVCGLKALSQKWCRELVEKLGQSENASKLVETGLKRLAFGSANDAVKLMFCEQAPLPEEIAKLDLFNVSEIKKIKGGGVEIKLFDRQKALEKLYELSHSLNMRSDALGLINALKGSSEIYQREEEAEHEI